MASPIALREFSEDEYRRFVPNTVGRRLDQSRQATPQFVWGCRTDESECVPETASNLSGRVSAQTARR